MKRILNLFLVLLMGLVSVFALGLANKEVKADEEFVIKIESKYTSSHGANISEGVIDEHLIQSVDNVLSVSYVSGRVNTIFGNSAGEIRLYNGSLVISVIDPSKYLISKISVQGSGSNLEIDNISNSEVNFSTYTDATTIKHNSSKDRYDINEINITVVEVVSDLTATINQLFDGTNTVTNEVSAAYGQDIVISIEEEVNGNDFQFGVVNGVVRHDLTTTNNTLPITDGLDVSLVYGNESNHAVLFIDSNGKLLSNTWVETDGSVEAPITTNLSKPGYEISDIPWLSNEDDTSLNNITSSRVYTLQYELVETPIEIIVNDTPNTYEYNEVVTITSTNPDFEAWVDEDENVLSTKRVYSFTALTDKTIVESTDEPTTLPVVTMTNDLMLRDDNQTFVGQLELKEGDTLVEYGLVVTDNGFLRDEVLTLENGTKARTNVLNSLTNEFMMSISEEYLVTRAYVVIRNENNELETFYSNNQYNDVAIVTFDTDGGDEIDPLAIKAGTAVQKPADPERPLHEFLGWFVGETAFNFDTAITADITLVAKWEEEEEADTITILTARGKDLGDEVTISGVVTRNHNGNIAVNDGTAAIIVYEKDSTVEVGDKILATGTLSEYYQTIQISGGTITVLDSDQALPNPVTLTTLENISDYHANHLTIENLEFISIDSSNRNITAKLGDFEVVVRSGSSSGAVADLFKTIKIGDLINVENVYADSYDGVIQLLVTEIESIEVEEKELTDLEKINFVKDELTIAGVAGVEGITLPNTGLYEVNISWSSSNPSVISNDGNVTLPTEETTVIMTATISLNTEQTTKTFDVVVHPEGMVVEPITIVAKYPNGSGTTNMSEGNNASTIGLDEAIFTVTSTERVNSPLHIGLNNRGEIRLYGSSDTNGNVLTISVAAGYSIKEVKINFGSTVAPTLIKVADAEVFNDRPKSNGTETITVNGSEFSIKNVNTSTGQIYILSIEITYIPN